MDLAGRVCGALLAILVAVGLSPWSFAKADEGPEATYDRLFQEVLKQPDNLDLLFRFAGLAVQLGNYESAISSYERMLLLNPNLSRVKLELGALYFRLGSMQAARRYFDDAADDPGVPPVVLSRVESFLKRIDEQSARSVWFGSAALLARYQSNANAGPDDNIVRALGVDSVLDNEFQARADGAIYGYVSLRNSYRIDIGSDAPTLGFDDGRSLSLDNEVFWQTDLQAYYSEQFVVTDVNVGLLSLESGPEFEFLAGNFGDTSIFVQPVFVSDYALLGTETYYWTVGGGVNVTVEITPETSLFGSYRLRYRDFQGTSDSPNLDELTGIENAFLVEARHYLAPNFRIAGGIFAELDDGEEAFQSNQELGLFTGFDWLFEDPVQIAWTQRPWQTSFRAEGRFTGYAAPDPSVDPDVTRRETEYRLTATQVIPVTDDISLIGQIDWQDQNSNLPNFAFTNLTVAGGVSLRF